MLTKYKSFLLERLVMDLSLLLEGSIYASDDFITKLEFVRNANNKPTGNKEIYDLTSKIIQQFRNDYPRINSNDIKQNFFDTTKSDDKVSFIQNNKVGSYWVGQPDNPYNMSGRSEMKVGRIIKYLSDLLNLKPTNKDIEDFVNIYKSTNTENKNYFKLVSGDEILKYYKNKNISSDRGTLGSSCMNNKSKKIFKIYTQNKDIVKLLVYLNEDGLLLGRALVWKLENSPSDAEYFMDRVYTNSDSDVNRFIQFAIENDWLYKKIMNSDDGDSVYLLHKGIACNGEITVKLEGDFKRYPYLDTLTFLHKDKNTLSNLPSKNCYIINDYDDGERYHCYDCDGKLYEIGSFSGKKHICFSCCEGHVVLNSLGIKTDVYKKHGE